MKTKVSIKGAEFYAFHGYYEEERKAGNTFVVDAEVTLKTFDSSDDNIQDTVNYESMYHIISQEMDRTQQLLETVVYNIITRFRDELVNVSSATVRLEKMAPQLGGKVQKSVVEMEF